MHEIAYRCSRSGGVRADVIVVKPDTLSGAPTPSCRVPVSGRELYPLGVPVCQSTCRPEAHSACAATVHRSHTDTHRGLARRWQSLREIRAARASPLFSTLGSAARKQRHRPRRPSTHGIVTRSSPTP
eukprot:2500859-Prymnesium_polylepis.2